MEKLIFMKKMKIIGTLLLIIILCYIVFIMVEVNRFNNNLGVRPLIVINSVYVDVETGSNIQKEKITGLGYTVNYEYLTLQDENSDNHISKIISGNFKLFDKFLLSAWMV